MGKKSCQTTSTRKTYQFSLPGIDINNIHKKYGILLDITTGLGCTSVPKKCTKITELSSQKSDIVSFVDESKKFHKCIVSSIDFDEITENKILYNCFWCRHRIPSNSCPVGCPISYVPDKAIMKYHSEITKDKYIRKEDITPVREEKIKRKKDKRIRYQRNSYYVTDGIFCSFNCVMAYIDDNKIDPKYSMSKILVYKMCKEIFPDVEKHIIYKAPHWRLLKEYGGNLTVEEFRESFNRVEYNEHGFVTNHPKQKQIGMLFEEKLKF